jgi:GDP-4-dehydro-6-deoxy-D-mannose reductase
MTKVLITGSSGFIGKHLTQIMRSAEFDVVAIDSSWGDVSEQTTWNDLPLVDIVIHLAGKSFVPASWEDPSLFFKSNVLGTIEALNYCKKNKSSLVFLSSYMYGNPEFLPIPETAKLEASNPYALSKKLAEEACRFYSNSHSLDITVLRPFNVYGTGQPTDFLIPSIISQIKNSDSILVKDLEPKRDYVYIDDLVFAIITAIQSLKGYKVYNIGSGISYSVAELIDILQELAGTSLPVFSAMERRKDEIMNTIADISLANQELTWHPKTNLKRGLKELLSFYQ